MDIKAKLLEVFNRLYQNCELYHITLNGFSHTVFYKDHDGNRHIDGISFFAPEQHYADYQDEGGNIESFNEDRTKVLFMGFNHSDYQNNPMNLDYTDKKWVD